MLERESVQSQEGTNNKSNQDYRSPRRLSQVKLLFIYFCHIMLGYYLSIISANSKQFLSAFTGNDTFVENVLQSSVKQETLL